MQVGNSLLCGKDSKFKDLPSGAQIVFLCMAMESGGKPEVAFSRNTAKTYGISKSALSRATNKLLETGFIEIAEDFSYAQFQPTVYRFIFDWKSRPENGPV